MNTICPHCKMLIPYSARLAGRPATCPLCHTPFEMPSPDEQAQLIARVDALKQEQSDRFEHARQRRVLPVAEGSRYPALRFIAGLLQFLALVVLLLSIAGLVAVALNDLSLETKSWVVPVLLVDMVFGPIFLWGMGELILLMIDIANDMRATRMEITRLRRKKG